MVICPRCGYRAATPGSAAPPPPSPPPSTPIQQQQTSTNRQYQSPQTTVRAPYGQPPGWPYGAPPAPSYGGYPGAGGYFAPPPVISFDKVPVSAFPGTQSQPFGLDRCQVCGADNGPRPLNRYYSGYVCSTCYRSLLWRRVGAFSLDLLVMIGFGIVGSLLFGLIFLAFEPSPSVQEILSFLAEAVIITPYLLGKDAWFKGRSIGKAASGITVVNNSTNSPIGPPQSVKRNAILMVFMSQYFLAIAAIGHWLGRYSWGVGILLLSIPALLSIEIYLFLFLPSWHGRRLGEKWADTRVIFTNLPAFVRHRLYAYAYRLSQMQAGTTPPSDDGKTID
jgi:hypothetical protein